MYRNIRNIDSSFVRDMNTKLVLNAVRIKRKTSRTVLAQLTSLSYPTVATIVKHLISDGLVSEDSVGKFRGGRKPMLLRFNPEARHVIGLDLSGAKAQAVLADLDGNFLSEVISGETLGLSANLTDNALSVLDQLEKKTRVDRHRLVGIGASIRGSFDLPNRLFYYSEDESAPIRLLDGLEHQYQVPIIMDHISNVALIAEKLYGVASNARTVAYVNVSSGVSAGLMLDGQIFRGIHGNAGELGHITVSGDSGVCPDCGRTGCLENIASLYGIIRLARNEGLALDETLHPHQQLEFVAKAAYDDVPAARVAFDRATLALAEGLIDLVNLINPEMIVMGGKVIRAYPKMVTQLDKLVSTSCWPYSRNNLTLLPASIAENILLQGAVSLVLAEVFLPHGISMNDSIPVQRSDKTELIY